MTVKLTLGEDWTPAIRAICMDVCADVGDPPCWSLACDDAHPNTPNSMTPCGICRDYQDAWAHEIGDDA